MKDIAKTLTLIGGILQGSAAFSDEPMKLSFLTKGDTYEVTGSCTITASVDRKLCGEFSSDSVYHIDGESCEIKGQEILDMIKGTRNHLECPLVDGMSTDKKTFFWIILK